MSDLRGPAEPDEIVMLADEELEALTDPDAVPLLPSPWLSRLAPAQREGALAAGFRALVTRGLVVTLDQADDRDGLEIGLDPDLADVLAVRAGAPLISLWTAVNGSGWSLHAYLSARSVLLEKITPSGRHGFVVSTAEELQEVFAEFARQHRTAVDDQGRPVVFLGILADRAAGEIRLAPTPVDDVADRVPAGAGASGGT